MSGARTTDLRICDPTNPPPAITALFADAARRDWFLGLDWFGVLARGASDPREGKLILAHEDATGTPRAALVLVRRGGTLSAFGNFYTCLYGPAGDAGAARELARAIARQADAPDAIDLNSLAAEAASTDALEAGLREGGFKVRRYFHFANWYENTEGVGYAQYLRARPSALRATIERRTRQFLAEGGGLDIVTGSEAIEAAIAAYEHVYARSWKGGEPYRDFAPTLIRAAAAAGVLRLGLARHDGAPIAAQIWLVHGGRASILKLAHDEQHARRSAGTVLTAHGMAHVLDRDRVREVDFGRGDDAYKRQWLASRRERVGLLAFNPRRPRGWTGIARHIVLPRLARAWRRDG